MQKSPEYFQKAQKVIPGGVNSPVRAFGSVNMTPLFISRAKGSRIFDVDGNEYIDYVGSWGPMILGHAHEEILETLRKTSERGTSFGAPTVLETELAEKIVDMVPSIEMVRLVNSGTEATMSASRLARGFTGRDRIVKFAGCYHGHGDSFLVQAGSGALTLGEPNSPGVPGRSAQDTLIADFNDLESVRRLFDESPDSIAAVIVEPVAGNMGVIPPDPGFLDGLRELCTRNGALLIFDEVMTGFRIHPGGAQEIYGIKPDLTTLGKVIGGGLPVGAYGGNAEIMKHVAPKGPVYQAGTLSGNPLAVSAGLKTLEIISRTGFFDRLNEKSTTFFRETKAFITAEGLPLTINFVNSMGCLFFKPGEVRTYSDAQECDTARFASFFRGLIESGIYIAPSQFEAMFISDAHTDKDLQRTGEIMRDLLVDMFN